MSNNVKRLFFVTTLVLLLFAIAAVSASDVSDDAALPGDSSVSVSAADSLVNDNNIVTDTVTRENNNKQEKTNIKKATLDTPKTVVVTSTNYSDVFTNTGLCSDVNDGDVIDVQSDITTNNFNITIDKAINLTTTTGAIINLNTTGGNLFGTNPGNSFKIVNSGSYTNVTNLKFYNTQVFVINAHHVTMDNINVTVNNQVVGSGVGVTSIRDNSTYVTVKNSNFYTKNNGGSSSVVLAWADYCTIDNNNITGEGNVGNLMYLTTYNINGTPEYAVDINMYNNITNNNITAVNVTGPCVGVVVTGHDNKFENNKVNVSSSFAGQWMSPTMNEQGDHDDRWEGNSYINNKVYGSFTGTKNSTITDNKFNKTVTLPERCIFKNNNAENSTVTVKGKNCDLCGNTINTLVVSAYPVYVCTDNIFTNYPTDPNISWYTHGSRSNNLNKNYLRSVKTSSVTDEIEYNEVDIDDEETFLKYFRYQENGGVYLPISNDITGNTRYKLGYFPENGKMIYFMSNMLGTYMKNHFSIVGKDGFTLNNVGFYIIGIHVSISNLNLNYNLEDEENPVNPIHCQSMGMAAVTDAYVEFDHLNITLKSVYKASTFLFNLNRAQVNDNDIIQNSIINVEVPAGSYNIINNKASNVTILNNTINVKEIDAVGENPSIIAINGLDSTNVTCISNNITMNGKSTLTAIKLNSNTNTITNNNITVTTTGIATGVELTGNNNTVTDNYIVANDKYGDSAVTATGENNVVENNTAPEGGNLIPTSIELTYDTTPIDVGQRLIIRGVFKADGVESEAQSINVYDNEELIATINTSDEYGTLTYGYTPTVGGSHNVKFAFDGNDTHNATSTVIIVETTTQLLSPVVNITADNFYDYFNSEGELDYQMLTDDTTYYFYSIPGDVSQISYTRLSNDVKDKNVTFAGTEDFVLTDTAIIIKSTTNNFRLVNMTIVYTDEYQQQDYILFAKTDATGAYIDNCNITANVTRQTPKGYPYSVISTANSPVVISNSVIKVDAVETEVDWEPNSPNYGNNNVIPIYTKYRSTLVNNTIEIHAVSDGSMYPTLYGIRLAGHASVMSENNITISGEGWLYAIQPMANNIEVTNNNINITGVNYTAGIMMENISNNTIDNNTIILNARTSREGMGNEPCTYGITIIDYMCGGTAYHETGNAVNNKITNNIITCTAYNMYGIEEFGGSNTTIENNTIVATGDTAMAVGVTGVNVLINNNNITVDGDSFSGTTVDYLGARTTGVYLGRGTNATVTNNNISSTYTGVYALAQNIATIEDNNITTTYNYTVLLDSTTQYATVENNYLETPGRLGDESVSDSGKDNTVQNNLPVVDKEYSLIVDTTEFVPGSTATISASIYYGSEYTQDVAANISKGKVSFKVNGKTLKDANGKVIYAKVVNGTATIEDYQIPDNWNNQTTIQAVYSGSGEVAKMSSEKTAITIVAREPTITTEDVTATAGSTITLTATINTDAVVNTGKVVFKINGKSVKDANGKVIYAKVSNNQVSVEYTLPDDMKTGTYNLTAVFISSEYDRLEDTKTLTVN